MYNFLIKKLRFVLLVILTFTVSACSSMLDTTYPTSKYTKPLDKSCDFSVATECKLQDQCSIRILTDVIEESMPWTCCPQNTTKLNSYIVDQNDLAVG